MDKNSNLFLISDKDKDIRFRIKPEHFTESWYVSEVDFYIQDFMVNGKLVTFALPW